MIKVKTLKKLLEQVPDEACVNAYEGEQIGIAIHLKDKRWWIQANEGNKEDKYTEGFNTCVDVYAQAAL